MIAWVREWIISVCIAVFFIMAVELILPKNSIRKYAKFVLGLILITVIINPFVKIFVNKYDSEKNISKAFNYMESQISEMNEDEYEKNGVNRTLEVFKDNIDTVCEDKLVKKYNDYGYVVDSKVKYDEENIKYSLDKIYIKVVPKGVDSVKKVDVSVEDNINTKEELKIVDNILSQNIKKFISNEFEMSEESIIVYED